MTTVSAFAWAYLAAAAYTSLLAGILVKASPQAAKDSADKVGVSVPVFVLGVGLVWFATLPLIVGGLFKDAFRRR